MNVPPENPAVHSRTELGRFFRVPLDEGCKVLIFFFFWGGGCPDIRAAHRPL